MNGPISRDAVAIVGMAGRFPGAQDVDSLWTMLLEGTEAVRQFTPAELRSAGVPAHHVSDPRYRPFAAELTGIENFDAAFFGITPAEARVMDPQHRIFLECVWTALEDAGTAPASCQGRIGVYGSSSLSSYLVHHVLASEEYRGNAFSYPVLLGNDKDFLATRVSYRLGLNGPSMTVQSGCSSSLVAVDIAKNAVLSGQCDVAVAGGVSICTPQTAGYLHQQGGTFSADGHCRPFDASATGMVRGSGCGVIVLKRLEQALAERDHIYAVIAATAVNNDGALKAGYTAPGMAGQTRVIETALAASGLPASAISYIETHGTGTFLGDPIEVAALTEAYTTGSDPLRQCALGSVKANIGHLDAAAGITGLIKAALVLHHQKIPPQINFTQPNPELRLQETPFTIHTQAVRPRDPIIAAAATSLGIGGTNAHCILTTPPPADPRTRQPAAGEYLLLLSGHDDKRLAESAGDLADYLQRHPATRLDDLAYTLVAGRQPLASRAAITATAQHDAIAALRTLAAGQHHPPDDLHAHAWTSGAPAQDIAVGDISQARKIRIPATRFRALRHWIDTPASPPPPGHETSQQQTLAADLLQAITDVFSTHLGIRSIEADDDYFDLGGESLGAVSLIDSLSRQLHIKLTLPQFTRLRTPQRLAQWVTTQRTPSAPRPDTAGNLELVKDGRPGREVFLVHPSGGTTLFAHTLAAHSTDPSRLYALGYPTDNPAPPATIPEMALRYVQAIRTVAPHGPYRIGGYSLGGTVALEMARLLTQDGEQVEKVILFDTLPPSANTRPFSEEEFLQAFPALLATSLDLPQTPILARPSTPEEAIDAVRQPSWTPATVRELRALYDVWLISARALSAHRLQPYDGPVHLLAAAQPIPPGLSGLPSTIVTDDAWKPFLTGALHLTAVPGNHFSMFHDHNLPALASAYDHALQKPPHRPRITPPQLKQRPTAWLFAGQGTQHPGMGQNLLPHYPELLAEADDILGYSTTRLCAGDPERPLTNTAYAQPAIYLINALAFRKHREETGEPDLALGHSLGEYNALEAAGAISFGDGLRLVARRAAAMARIESGGMLALTGIPEQRLLELLATEDFQHVDPAAFNAPLSQTLAGPERELDRLTPLLLAHGARALRRLNVSGPFHSRHMQPAACELQTALRNITWRRPAFPVFANTTARPHQPHTIPAQLTAQLTRPVRWRQAIERAIGEHAPRFHEIGDQYVLTPMTAQIQAALSNQPMPSKDPG
ncbi:beta-ketoacyl synthase N-terminal-like domain-containing protein [Streptomyces sp. NPDC053431]|uniref:beta-ketoacyl synthase N-terminal-like domain-containing protein n=1 Tax=Streptomyces sp. NPDC053431 TaxID=3365703 RepID=UPI0037CEB3AF